jgi:hypothetical protein
MRTAITVEQLGLTHSLLVHAKKRTQLQREYE